MSPIRALVLNPSIISYLGCVYKAKKKKNLTHAQPNRDLPNLIPRVFLRTLGFTTAGQGNEDSGNEIATSPLPKTKSKNGAENYRVFLLT